MKTLHKIMLGLLAVAALATATPAQAYHRYDHGRYYGHSYYYHHGYYGYYYGHGFYPYYAGPYPYYYGPYNGPGVAVAVTPFHRHHFFFFF